MTSVHLHEALVQALTQIGVEASKPQRENLALLCQGLAVSPTCHLSTLALGLPLRGNLERAIQRLSRLLASQTLEPRWCYRPVAAHLVQHWTGRELNLVMDRTDIADRWSVLMLGLAYGKRVLPLTWELLSYGGTSADTQIRLVRRVASLVGTPADRRVHLYADGEFRAVALQQVCRELGWHWQVGIKGDTAMRLADGRRQLVRDLGLTKGERRYVQQITLTDSHEFGPVNLLADWAPTQETPRYWVLDQVADGQAWRRGRKRFWIEPTFRDWKSAGFDLEGSKLEAPERLNILLLGIATTSLWLIHLGDRLLRTGRVRLVLPQHRDDSSLFRLGRDFLQRARTLHYSIPVGFTVPYSP